MVRVRPWCAAMVAVMTSAAFAEHSVAPLDPLTIARHHLESSRSTLGLSAADIADLEVTDHYATTRTGTTHVYLRQRVDGIAVVGGVIGIHVGADGEVIHLGDRLVRSLTERVDATVVELSPQQAVESAAAALGLPAPTDLRLLEHSNSERRETVFSNGGISFENIPAKLIYQSTESGRLRLAWDIGIYEPNQLHYWKIALDAETGRILHLDDLVDQAFYRVYQLPVESPQHTTPLPPADARTVEANTGTAASPFGWHDIDGATGSEFTITAGNNVHAYEDISNSGSGFSPDCGGPLFCDFPINLNVHPNNHQSASITNLFYWNNKIHDVMHGYGFDEAAGNFQVNNYGNGGVGGDDVRAEAQDGGGNCNANFLTHPDGERPRMQMYLCDDATPERDGSLDDAVIVHEYGHGISNRLTGGPGSTVCLNHVEQMGEGWSDWYAMVMTQQAADGATPRGIGSYLFALPPDQGIRPAPYTTNFVINDATYDDIKTAAIPHGVGWVWASMLWDLSWKLVDQHGFNPDIYGDWTTGGNNLAMQIVTDGMKFQSCWPGFVDARNGILAADAALTGGANACVIWRAFARRGLGLSADQGTPFDRTDGTEAFDYPAGCAAIFSDGFESGNTSAWSDTVP